MRKLSYGSFEEVLRAHITPKITKLRLAEILLTSPVVDARKKDRTIQRKSCNIDSSIVTRVCSGERGLPPSLREYHAKPMRWTISSFASLLILFQESKTAQRMPC